MEWLIITLFVISALLFLISFLAKDKDKKIQEVEETSLKTMGEIYQIKNRIKYLEEELLAVSPRVSPTNHSTSHRILENEAYELFQKGKSPEEIASAMQLNIDEVRYLLTKLQ